jgi:hypothetical protein
MPVRLLVYMVCLWIDLLKNIPLEVRSRQDFRLPAIIPLVLYNGEDRARVYRGICQGAVPEAGIGIWDAEACGSGIPLWEGLSP